MGATAKGCHSVLDTDISRYHHDDGTLRSIWLSLSDEKVPFIAIERESASNAMESINSAIQAITHGESVIIFAEGTRSKDGKLQQFKRGGFYLAARSHKPIVPIVLKGTHLILPKKSLKFNSGRVDLVIQPSIRIETELTRNQEKDLMKNVWENMNVELERLN